MIITTEYTPDTQVDVIEIKSAAYTGDFIVHIDFSDGTSQDIDFRPFLSQTLHPSIRQYLDKTRFQQFDIVDGNLNWHDYELVFPLDALYKGCVTPLHLTATSVERFV